SAFVLLLSTDYKKKENEARAFVKNIMKTKVDILPDYESNTLTIALYSLATPRDNKAAKKLCQLLNETETFYPGTSLRLFYKIASG
ncbi:MAG: hypothetical protein KA792_01725, partial [Bacteroidales bacterium]|nr:hypothetical protein [Bacteroidales bacterium]